MDIIIKSLIISFACIGLRIISSPGMILYFLRMPFDKLKEGNAENKHIIGNCRSKIEQAEFGINDTINDKHIDPKGDWGRNLMKGYRLQIESLKLDILKLERRKTYNWLLYAMKPVILCVTCMSSAWTIVIELGYYNTLSLQSVIIAFVVAALNSIIYASYEKLTK